MGIFSNKQDETQSAPTNSDINIADNTNTPMTSPSTATVSSTDSIIAPSVQTAPPLNTNPDDGNDGYLTTGEPIESTIPASVASNDTKIDPAVSTTTLTSITDEASAVSSVTAASPVLSSPAVVTPVADVGTSDSTSADTSSVLGNNLETTPATSISVIDASTTINDITDAGDSTSDLADIKKEAIEKLSPLIPLLDQTPEEKFHTTMMLLQSTDNKALIKDAYNTAQLIADEKVKAQALLDVVNEINYYTQTANN